MRVHGSGKNVSLLREAARRFGLPVAALFCGLGLAGCERAADGPAAAPAPVSFPTASSTTRAEVTVPPDSPQAAQLKIEPVRIREIAVDEVTAPGRIGIDPNRTSRLLIPVAERVVAVLAKVGDAVEQGQRVLDVDSPDADAAIAAAIQAEAAERQAQAALPAAQTVGPRDAVEAAVARFMNIVQSGRSDGAAVTADRRDAIREIVREMGEALSGRRLRRSRDT